MRRAVGLSPETGKRSSHPMRPGDPHRPEAAGSRRPSPPVPPESRGCRKPSPARARRVVFEDEVMPPGRPPGRVPSGRVPPTKEGKKPGVRSVPPALAPRPRAVPDYVVKYPAIRTPWQREGYKGVFQDQRAEYTELLGEGGSKVAHVSHEYVKKRDLAFLEKQQQRCEYLKKKLTHIKARIQEYDRDARDAAVSF